MNPDRPFAPGRQTVVFVLRRLVADSPPTLLWLERIRAFEEAGWATHVAFIRADPDLEAKVEALRSAERLPGGTDVHHFALRDRRVRPAWWAPRPAGEPVEARIGDWLDWLTGAVPGAAVIADEPASYAYVAAMTNPLVARIAALHDPEDGPTHVDAPEQDQDPDSDPGPDNEPRPTTAELLAAFDGVALPDRALSEDVRAAIGPGPRIVVIPATRDSSGGGPGGNPAKSATSAAPATWATWVTFAADLAQRACDHRSPSLLIESVATSSRILRLTGVLADNASTLDSWSFDLPTLVEPAGWITDPPPVVSAEDADSDDPPVHPHAAGPTREVVCEMRSNAMAFVANRQGPFVIEYGDGTNVVPLRTTAFDRRLIASRAGNATMVRQADGTVHVSALPELLYAHIVEGRLLIQAGANGTPSDITHALGWGCDVDWADLTATPQGATFTGRLRATNIAPADDSPPSICVSDVGGYSRSVGALHYVGEPTIEGLSWSRPVAGVLETDPLVATTDLSGGALSLHVGFRGMLVPVGGLWTHGQRARMHLTCPRGSVTLLPSPGGRVLVAPGRGYRARTSGAIRRALSRG